MHELSEPLQASVEQQGEPVEVYDDGPWTDDEKTLLAAESGRDLGCDEMTEYDG